MDINLSKIFEFEDIFEIDVLVRLKMMKYICLLILGMNPIGSVEFLSG